MSIIQPQTPENIKYSYKTILKIYFNFTFCMCISPFRFTKTTTHWNKTVKYSIKKFTPQLVICGLMHLLIIYYYLIAIRSVNFKKLAQNPLVYFELFQTVTNSFYRIAFCIMLWTNQKKLLKVMEFSGDLPSPSDKVVKRITPLTILLCTLYTSIALASGILGDEFASHSTTNDDYHAATTTSRWNPSSFLQAYCAKAKYHFFLSNNTFPTYTAINNNSTNGTTLTMSDMDLGDVLFGILGMAMSISRNLCTFHSNLFLLLITISLACHAKGLYRLIVPAYLDTTSSSLPPLNEFKLNIPVDVVLSKYRGLKELSRLLNVNFGHLILLYVLTSIATIATYLDSVIVEPDIFTRIRIGWSANTFIIILTVGSNICNQISELKTWLSKGDNSQQLSMSRLVIFLDELNDNPVGISGMGLFTVHYKFVTGLVSTLVTYFIIMLQFQVAVRDSE